MKQFLVTTPFVLLGFVIGTYTMEHFFPKEEVKKEELTIKFGPPDVPECQAEVSVSTFQELNDAGLWAWPAACMEAKEANK